MAETASKERQLRRSHGGFLQNARRNLVTSTIYCDPKDCAYTLPKLSGAVPSLGSLCCSISLALFLQQQLQ